MRADQKNVDLHKKNNTHRQKHINSPTFKKKMYFCQMSLLFEVDILNNPRIRSRHDNLEYIATMELFVYFK